MTVAVAIVGCGNVSPKYLDTIIGSAQVEVIGCADLEQSKAATLAAAFGIHAYESIDELCADPRVQLVVNLTAPVAHAEVSLRAIAHGKHVYSEKPLAASVSDARRVVAAAAAAGVQLGCAPDTFLGVGLQATKRLIADGAIGRPISALSVLATQGPELFHPGPEFLYRSGAGPLFDIGPYLVTTLTFLLGPVRAVSATTATPVKERTIRVGERAGEGFTAAVPTFISAVLEFDSGAIATVVQGWDVVGTTAPRLEIHGTEGSISAPSPDSWDGPVRLQRAGESEFVEVVSAVPAGGSPGSLGMGVLQMAEALESGQVPAGSGARGLHTLEVLHAILSSAAAGRRVTLSEGLPAELSSPGDQ